MGLKAKDEFNYFDCFLQIAQSATSSAHYLNDAFMNFDVTSVSSHVEAMHKIENDADTLKHELTRRLARDFITPIELEDIAALAQELDNIVDAIEDVMRRVYMFNVPTLRKEAIDFTDLIVRCCEAFEKVVCEFRNFKKSKTMSSYIIEVNTLESTGDKLHAESIRRLFTENAEPKTMLIW
ncbi:MAG: DUF47 family protein, partial [Oscillospiraceae bacterium]